MLAILHEIVNASRSQGTHLLALGKAPENDEGCVVDSKPGNTLLIRRTRSAETRLAESTKHQDN